MICGEAFFERKLVPRPSILVVRVFAVDQLVPFLVVLLHLLLELRAQVIVGSIGPEMVQVGVVPALVLVLVDYLLLVGRHLGDVQLHLALVRISCGSRRNRDFRLLIHREHLLELELVVRHIVQVFCPVIVLNVFGRLVFFVQDFLVLPVLFKVMVDLLRRLFELIRVQNVLLEIYRLSALQLLLEIFNFVISEVRKDPPDRMRVLLVVLW